MKSVNPKTATEYWRVECRSPPPNDNSLDVSELPTFPEARKIANAIRFAAGRLHTALGERAPKQTGTIKVWRCRSTTGGGRIQMNLVPEEEWKFDA